MKNAVLAGLGVLLLVTAACGGDPAPSETEDGKRIVASVSAALIAPDQGVGSRDARCIARRFVDDFGVKKLVSSGVVGKDFAYDSSKLTSGDSAAIADGLAAARGRCLEVRVAASMAKVIGTEGGLVSDKKAGCVARDFTRAVGLEKLIAGQVVDTKLGYVSNGALQDPANATAYAKALSSCLGEKKVSAAAQKAVEAAFEAGNGGPTTTNVSCLVGDFMDRVGVGGLFANQLVTDTGVFNTAGARYDEKSATALADAMLGCVDALKSEADAAVASDPELDATKLEACLKKNITPVYLRDYFLVNQLLGKDQKAQHAAAVIQNRAKACQQEQK
ncbi:hypothetical protein ABIE44_001985 [Marmoricola sp. OAE513]|uniref:hypothetical protein n=1 Tax=Marmoricola sp. OAE513 TaxID=2817894 RepID=UPI001AE97E6F